VGINAARHGRRTTWARHDVCEVALKFKVKALKRPWSAVKVNGPPVSKMGVIVSYRVGTKINPVCAVCYTFVEKFIEAINYGYFMATGQI
jgi:hypothetical protein